MAMSVAPSVRILTDRSFFTGIALAMAAAAFVGFAPTYFLVAFNDRPTPPLTPSVHLHGALSTAWMLLFVLQTSLIATRRYDTHRLTGALGGLLAAAILVSGLMIAIASERRVHSEVTAGTMADPYVFLMFPVANVSIFGAFVLAGVLNRNRPDTHKRMMLFATISLLGPALARIYTQATGAPGALAALVMMDVFIAALVAYDLFARRQLHPATLWGGGLFLASEPLRIAIAHTAPWQAVARSLMG